MKKGEIPDKDTLVRNINVSVNRTLTWIALFLFLAFFLLIPLHEISHLSLIKFTGNEGGFMYGEGILPIGVECTSCEERGGVDEIQSEGNSQAHPRSLR